MTSGTREWLMGPNLSDDDRDELEREYEQDIADGNPEAFDPDDCLNDWDDPFGNQNETIDGMD